MSNSDVTVKVTQSHTFRIQFSFENPKLSLKEIQKNIIIRKVSKTQLSHLGLFD